MSQAKIYWDGQDIDNIGWAYRIEGVAPKRTGHFAEHLDLQASDGEITKAFLVEVVRTQKIAVDDIKISRR